MDALRSATLTLALIAAAVGAEARPGPADVRVAVEDLSYLVEPDDSAYSTGIIRRGTRLAVLGEKDGWATIAAPADAFAWVDAAQLRDEADGSCVVTTRQATLRHAATGADAPGPTCGLLARGAAVRALDLPDLVVGRGAAARTYRAVEPDNPGVRYVRVGDLAPPDDPAVAGKSPPVAPEPDARPERLASFEQPDPDNKDLPPGVNAELASIRAAERSARSVPLESWDLGPIRGRYEAVLRRSGTDSAVRAAVQSRLDRLAQDEAAARAARDVARLLQDGDRRDAEITRLQREVIRARAREDRKFDAQGLLQPSSRRYQGQKVHALIGPEGRAIGYVQLPPGVPVARYMEQKVGVRGIVRFDEGLGARLISVRDIEVIERR